MKMSKAIDGYLLHKRAEGLSRRTIDGYSWAFDHFLTWIADDRDVTAVTTFDIVSFFDYMKNEYKPVRLSGDDSNLSSQSIRNLWIALSSFYTWAELMLELKTPVRGRIPRPRAENEPRTPFTEAEIKALFKSVTPKRANRPRSGREYLLTLRDRALLAVLLDTGVRNSELCSLIIGDIHMASGKIKVHGKGNRYRYVQMGEKTKSFLWHYLMERDDGDKPAAPVIATHDGEPMNRRWLARHIGGLGVRAGIAECYPHKFRYTFAIQYLRNGGDLFTLQSLLGHSSLKMVQHYAKVAGVDVERMHQIASPMDNYFSR
jgi:integrase/recombinase XerD